MVRHLLVLASCQLSGETAFTDRPRNPTAIRAPVFGKSRTSASTFSEIGAPVLRFCCGKRLPTTILPARSRSMAPGRHWDIRIAAPWPPVAYFLGKMLCSYFAGVTAHRVPKFMRKREQQQVFRQHAKLVSQFARTVREDIKQSLI